MTAEYLTLAYRSHKYYRESVHFLQATGVRGNLYNPYWMGGFAGYWLSPRLRTFIDGRTEHYDAEVFREHAAVQDLSSVRDGEPFTADDIVFWYEDVLMNEELTPAPNSWFVVDGEPGVPTSLDLLQVGK